LLEALAGTAGAEIIPPELFLQQFLAVNNPLATLDVFFRGISSTTLAHRLEKNGCSSNCS